LQQSSNYSLNTRFIIRQFLAGLLLIVFAFSITPRQVLHDWLANHKDTASHCSFEGVTHFSTDGFHCNCDNLVAESPFTWQHHSIEFHQAQQYAVMQGTVPPRFYPQTHFFFSLRGPPTVAFL